MARIPKPNQTLRSRVAEQDLLRRGGGSAKNARQPIVDMLVALREIVTMTIREDTMPLGLSLPADLLISLGEAAALIVSEAHQQSRGRGLPEVGRTLRPGKGTPLWNTLRDQLKPHLSKRGSQAELGRLLNLPRQQINAFLAGTRMPDAERTLQLLAWLMSRRTDQDSG